ncbi:hypothetical protein Patl1_10955 [Pistacia atlantica]|uniref:Uncharacterized protein n=1 Tax=Pistacia atlantica TaxID=434234 RepID=A0ACC1A798_9ROSI|nr:hypothetical protein Patl1_10955 [Pistacia atlantica]
MADSSHEFSNQNFFQYNPTPYYDASYPSVNHSAIAYSVSTFCEPKSIVYNPSVTHSRVSYSISNSEFDDTEFEEYDPTPYWGGYDITQTYGKPLPPSDNLCYPRSMSDSSVLPSNGVNLGSIESPYGKKDVDESAAKPHIEREDGHENNCEDNPARPNNGNRSNEGNSYEYDTRVTQTPSGYGLEAMDLCESIFGYWPCLARNNKRGHDCQQVFNEESSGNLWKETADYLFGSSNPYGENRDGGGSY